MRSSRPARMAVTTGARRWIRPMSFGQTRFTLCAAALSVALAACAASDGTTPPPSPRTDSPAASPTASPTGTPTETATESPSPTAADGDDLAVDGLAEVMVDGLTLRREPGTAGEPIGLLPANEPAYVVAGPVEADGYQWYQLASVRQPNDGTCDEPAPEPSLECTPWFGWAAGRTGDGERWLSASQPACPTARDTEAYLSIRPAERLACAAGEEWRLRAYVAPETEGRGCLPVYLVDPLWLDGSCNLFTFLQPEESRFDSFERLHVFVHPDLGACIGEGADCPLDAFKGSWIEVVGHVDDAAAQTCEPVLSSNFEEAPYPPPSTEEVVFGCRTRFVVTEIFPA